MARKKGLSFIHKKKISVGLLHEIWSWFFCVGLAVLLAFVVVTSVGMKISVIGVSMEPELLGGQEVLVNQFKYRLFAPKQGDVIVFWPNGNQNSHYYVKRVVAVGGERVLIEDGRLYVDGVVREEAFDKIADPGIAKNEILLGPDEYFVMGDNRNNSEDSRSANIGNVREDMIIGKVWFRLAYADELMGFVR